MSETWDPQAFLNTPIHAFDFQVMIGDIIDFLEFSENNIEWQLRRELQEIRRRDELEGFPPGYREHLEENAEFRFGVSLPLRVRYAAVISLVTSVEWSMRHLVKHFKVPNCKNETIRCMMKGLQDFTRIQRNEDITVFEDILQVRNCIVHSAGLLRDDKYSDEISASVRKLDGFSLENRHFLGTHVYIQRGALNPYAERMKQLVIELRDCGNRQSTASAK
ncbi:MAG: hypothetical protein OXS28_05010 [Gammaproteobacteria bacterium]|nr:hypothetical protein [Gammaproteobacteria bacterium]